MESVLVPRFSKFTVELKKQVSKIIPWLIKRKSQVCPNEMDNGMESSLQELGFKERKRRFKSQEHISNDQLSAIILRRSLSTRNSKIEVSFFDAMRNMKDEQNERRTSKHDTSTNVSIKNSVESDKPFNKLLNRLTLNFPKDDQKPGGNTRIKSTATTTTPTNISPQQNDLQKRQKSLDSIIQGLTSREEESQSHYQLSPKKSNKQTNISRFSQSQSNQPPILSSFLIPKMKNFSVPSIKLIESEAKEPKNALKNDRKQQLSPQKKDRKIRLKQISFKKDQFYRESILNGIIKNHRNSLPSILQLDQELNLQNILLFRQSLKRFNQPRHQSNQTISTTHEQNSKNQTPLNRTSQNLPSTHTQHNKSECTIDYQVNLPDQNFTTFIAQQRKGIKSQNKSELSPSNQTENEELISYFLRTGNLAQGSVHPHLKPNDNATPSRRNENATPSRRNENATPSRRNDNATPSRRNENATPSRKNENATPLKRYDLIQSQNNLQQSRKDQLQSSQDMFLPTIRSEMFLSFQKRKVFQPIKQRRSIAKNEQLTGIQLENSVVEQKNALRFKNNSSIPVQNTSIPVQNTSIPVQNTSMHVQNASIPIQNNEMIVQKSTMIPPKNSIIPFQKNSSESSIGNAFKYSQHQQILPPSITKQNLYSKQNDSPPSSIKGSNSYMKYLDDKFECERISQSLLQKKQLKGEDLFLQKRMSIFHNVMNKQPKSPQKQQLEGVQESDQITSFQKVMKLIEKREPSVDHLVPIQPLKSKFRQQGQIQANELSEDHSPKMIPLFQKGEVNDNTNSHYSVKVEDDHRSKIFLSNPQKKLSTLDYYPNVQKTHDSITKHLINLTNIKLRR